MICTWESRYSFPSLSYTLKTTGRQESHLTLTITSLTSYIKLAAITQSEFQFTVKSVKCKSSTLAADDKPCITVSNTVQYDVITTPVYASPQMYMKHNGYMQL